MRLVKAEMLHDSKCPGGRDLEHVRVDGADERRWETRFNMSINSYFYVGPQLMRTALVVFSVVLAVVVVAFVLMVRSHRAWLAKQTPAGVWRGDLPEGHLTLEFEGGPSEGLYKQVAVKDGVTVREHGHWQYSSGQLQLLILATDETEHPGLGVSTVNTIRYVGPDEIGIEGLHRTRLVYKRVPVGVHVQMEPAGEQNPV